MFFIEFTSKNTVLEAIFFKKSLHFYHFFAKIRKKLTKINKIHSPDLYSLTNKKSLLFRPGYAIIIPERGRNLQKERGTKNDF
jgi:hypothetical protein